MKGLFRLIWEEVEKLMLKIEDLHVSYGAIKALDGISLNVEEGEIVTLIGANGAGKSTTLRAISGLEKAGSGKIIFEGNEITNVVPHKIVEMGISHVPEGRRVFANLSIFDNLRLGANLRKDDKAIKEDLEKVYTFFPILFKRKSQLAGTLSGGEQQMLAVGRALMTRGKLMLLDEPSMGLAPLVVEEIFRIIQEINKQGTTILLIEQNAYMALGIANRGYVLETGKIILHGKASDLANNDEIRRAYLGG
jgi:branched-chain amino acid transport system ATP-binding protein